jgi:predicted dehydrogenase
VNDKMIRWGIIGLGKIAHKFASDLLLVDNTILAAVASRNQQKAQLFAEQYSVTSYYDSYFSLLHSDKVDIVYIATPHNLHKELSIAAMAAGKAVLCEKPVVVNCKEIEELLQVANSTKCFFMEGLWTRFNPTIEAILEDVQDGKIGKISHLQADFSFRAIYGSNSRLFDPLRAGGALLDVGIYPLFLAYIIFGMPKRIEASSILYDNGIDLQTTILLEYKHASASLMCGILVDSNVTALLYGSEGSIHIHRRWHESDGYSIIKNGEKADFLYKKKGLGFTYEIEECNSCLRNGKLESAKWSHQNSKDLILLLDSIREIVGIRYPFEK